MRNRSDSRNTKRKKSRSGSLLVHLSRPAVTLFPTAPSGLAFPDFLSTLCSLVIHHTRHTGFLPARASTACASDETLRSKVTAPRWAPGRGTFAQPYLRISSSLFLQGRMPAGSDQCSFSMWAASCQSQWIVGLRVDMLQLRLGGLCWEDTAGIASATLSQVGHF